MRTLLFAAVAASVSCHGSAPTEAHADQAFSLAPGSSAVVRSTGLTVTFDRVTEDSRCPIGVFCIQAGNGQVQLVVRSSTVDTLALNTTQGAHSRTVGNWAIELAALDPLPRADSAIKPDDYRATLTVRRAQ